MVKFHSARKLERAAYRYEIFTAVSAGVSFYSSTFLTVVPHSDPAAGSDCITSGLTTNKTGVCMTFVAAFDKFSANALSQLGVALYILIIFRKYCLMVSCLYVCLSTVTISESVDGFAFNLIRSFYHWRSPHLLVFKPLTPIIPTWPLSGTIVILCVDGYWENTEVYF